MDPIRRVGPDQKRCRTAIGPGYHIETTYEQIRRGRYQSRRWGYSPKRIFTAREGPPQPVTCRQAFLHSKRLAKQEGVLYASLHCPKSWTSPNPNDWRWNPPSYFDHRADAEQFAIVDQHNYAFSAPWSLHRGASAQNSWGPWRNRGERHYLNFVMDGTVWSGFVLGCNDYGVFRPTKYVGVHGQRPPLTADQKEKKRLREAKYRKAEREAEQAAWHRYERTAAQQRGRFV